jgi:ketosteroid isomerase-like protein
MKSFSSAILAVLLLTAATTPALAQDWSAEQKEVWKNVEAYWALDAAGDTAGFLAYFHESYSGWSNRFALPGDKATVQKFVTHGHKTGKTLVHHIQPAAIKVHGNIAIVHYHWAQGTQAPDQPEEHSFGRWTDILMKQGDKWVLIGDHGGRTSKPD